MKGWLVVNAFLHSNKFNEIHFWLLKAAKKQDIDLKLVTNAELLIDLSEGCYGSSDPRVDFVLFWDKDTRLAYHLEQLGYPVFNSSRAIAVCDDKSKTHLTLAKSGIPMPRTIIAPMTYDTIGYTNRDFIKEAADRLGFPMVIKECFGSFGQQVYLVHNETELSQKVSDIGTRPFIFQQYIEASHGKDIRLQVVGGRVIAAMLRYSETGDFRANLTIGGSMKAYEPTKEQCNLAIRCCDIIGLDFAGVDILFGDNGQPIVCEVNSNAHFKNIHDCTGINAADKIISHIRDRLTVQIDEY